MIRIMKASDLAQCGRIYAKAFPIEHWGIDWTAENAIDYLQDFFEQKRFVGYVYEENEEVLGCIFALCKIAGSQRRSGSTYLKYDVYFGLPMYSSI